jgi:hypothetical protein
MFTIISLLFSGASKLLSGFFGMKTSEVNDQTTVDVARIEGTSTVESKWWFVALLLDLFALPFAMYLWKSVAWDKLIAPELSWCKHACATTDPINGYNSIVFGIVVTGLFMYGLIK